MSELLTKIADKHKESLPWLKSWTILLVKSGSHAYGTNTPTSDLDAKGVAIASSDYYLGFSKSFEQAESKGEVDAVIYEMRKFFKLCADNNPNILEVVWTNDDDVLFETPLGKELRDLRHMFLSRKVKHTFSGYAASQLKRIKGHYKWLKDPPKHQPTRSEFGLPEFTLIPADHLIAARAAVQKKIDSWQMDLSFVDDAVRAGIEAELHRVLDEQEVNGSDQWTRAARTIGLNDNLIELMSRERNYESAKKHWQQYQEWKKTRNEARATLEEKWGYDTKHAMHLVRLLRMCREILEGKGVLVKRPDAEELLAIRNGVWTYEALVEWAEAEDKALNAVAKSSPLPPTPPREALDIKCHSLIQECIQKRLKETRDYSNIRERR